jgi:hypothetical protein
MIDKNYFLNQLENYLHSSPETIHAWRKVKLRYMTKKVGENRYQVIDTETNEPLWTTQASYGNNIWYCVMSLEEAEQLIKDQLEDL